MEDTDKVQLRRERDAESGLCRELEQLLRSDTYTDTTLVCRDGRVETSAVLAALAYPELASAHLR